MTVQELISKIRREVSTQLSDYSEITMEEYCSAINKTISDWNVHPISRGNYEVRRIIGYDLSLSESVTTDLDGIITLTTDVGEELNLSGSQTNYYLYISGLTSGNGYWSIDKVDGHDVLVTSIDTESTLISETKEAEVRIYYRYNDKCFYDFNARTITTCGGMKVFNNMFISDSRFVRVDKYNLDNNVLGIDSSYYSKIAEDTYVFNDEYIEEGNSLYIAAEFLLDEFPQQITSTFLSTEITWPYTIQSTIVAGAVLYVLYRYGKQTEMELSRYSEHRNGMGRISADVDEKKKFSFNWRWTP